MPKCNKERFQTKQSAQTRAKELRKHSNNKLRPYVCEWCEDWPEVWHLTSKSKAVGRSIQRSAERRGYRAPRGEYRTS